MNYYQLLLPSFSLRYCVWGAVVALAIVAFLLVWHLEQKTPEVVTEMPVLESDQSEDVLYVSAATRDGMPMVYVYNRQEKRLETLIEHEAWGYGGKLDGYHTLIAYSPTANSDPDRMVPAFLSEAADVFGALGALPAQNERDLTVAPAGYLYAYAFQEPNASQSPRFEDWSIAIYDDRTGDYAIIPAAGKPVWAPDASGLWFLTTDGVYFYDIGANQQFLVYDGYQDLTQYDDFTVSADGRTLLITVPSLGEMTTVSLGYDKLALGERWTVSMGGELWRTPQINPKTGEIALVFGVPEAPGAPTVRESGLAYVSPEGVVTERRSMPDIDTKTLMLEYWEVN